MGITDVTQIGTLMKLFSVITVCLNTEDVIEQTIQSILEQDCNNFEYLIKDGGSCDRTLEIAESFRTDFEERGISYRIISKSDTGVYDAMNQAVEESQGTWLIFINAGDRFAGSTILTQVQNSSSLDAAEIVYGDLIYWDQGLYSFMSASPLDTFFNAMPISHPSTFTRRSLLIATPYDTQYRICGDYDFYIRMYLNGIRFAYIPLAISVFQTGGISSDHVARLKENLHMLENLPVRDEVAIQKRIAQLDAYSRERPLIKIYQAFVPVKVQRAYRYMRKRMKGWKTEEEFFANQNKDVP